MSSGLWEIVLDQLLSPIFHVHLLDALKKADFLTLCYADIKRGFIYRLEELITITHDNYFTWNIEGRDSSLFFNILTFIGVQKEKSFQLAQNCVKTGRLQEITTYLQSEYEKTAKTL